MKVQKTAGFSQGKKNEKGKNNYFITLIWNGDKSRKVQSNENIRETRDKIKEKYRNDENIKAL